MKEIEKIPTQIDEPNGLHQRYLIKKLVKIPNPDYIPDSVLGLQDPEIIVTKDVDKGSEYFVMRLDENGKDPNHINACRIGVHAYANAIYPFIPELAKDLRERYSVSNSPANDYVEKQMYYDLSDDFNRLMSDYLALKQSAELSISQLNGEKAGLEIERDKLREAFEDLLKLHCDLRCKNDSTTDFVRIKWRTRAGLI